MSEDEKQGGLPLGVPDCSGVTFKVEAGPVLDNLPADGVAMYGARVPSPAERYIDALEGFAERGSAPAGFIRATIEAVRGELRPGRYETETTWAPSIHLTRPEPVVCQSEPEAPDGEGWVPFAGGVHDGVLFTRWRRVVRS